jgi:hypothetical protein
MTSERKHLALAERVEARTGLAAWPDGRSCGQSPATADVSHDTRTLSMDGLVSPAKITNYR